MRTLWSCSFCQDFFFVDTDRRTIHTPLHSKQGTLHAILQRMALFLSENAFTNYLFSPFTFWRSLIVVP